MKRIITLVVVAVAVCVFFTADVDADFVNWVISPGSNTGDPTTAVSWVGGDLIIGTPTLEPAQQPVGVYGAGAALPTAYNATGFEISFDWEFYTWDSYNPYNPTLDEGGYWDSFSATITKGDYYWIEHLTDPITTDPDIETIILLEAGTDEEVLETYTGPWTTFVFNPSDGDQYYLNLVIDTATAPHSDIDVPSWGVFSDVTVTPVPVPGAVLLGILGLGVAGVKLRKFA